MYYYLGFTTGRSFFYKFKPTAILSESPMFYMNDREQNVNHPYLISLPMYATRSGLSSVKDIPFSRLVIKMKDGYTDDEELELVNQLKDNLPDYLES